jgi:hypothetical protein
VFQFGDHRLSELVITKSGDERQATWQLPKAYAVSDNRYSKSLNYFSVQCTQALVKRICDPFHLHSNSYYRAGAYSAIRSHCFISQFLAHAVDALTPRR